jgi:curved DNA-binding protein
MEFKDYYKILGVPRTASQEEIKKAYRRLARKFHPDVSKQSDAEERFKEVNEANEVLADPQKRADYDQLGSNWRSGQQFRPPPGWQPHRQKAGEAGVEFSDFFENLFGARRRAAGHSGWGKGKPADIGVQAEISLEQAISGTEVMVNIGGNAQRVRIPPGAQDGTRLRVRGRGAESAFGGESGDIVLEIRVRQDERYRLEGRDLHRDIPIAPWEAAMGATIEVPTPSGMVKLKIPAGSRSGRTMRLKGRGLPGKTPGDLMLRLMIETPPLEDARDWYEKMAQESSFKPRAGLKP